jgi:hypothetical protein
MRRSYVFGIDQLGSGIDGLSAVVSYMAHETTLCGILGSVDRGFG